MNDATPPAVRRVLGLTWRDRITLFVLSVVFVLCVAGGWLARRYRETTLPPRQNTVTKVDINSAGRLELTLLPGIGEKTAQLIVEDRERNGPFATVEDLSRVHGIGPSTVKRIMPYAECR